MTLKHLPALAMESVKTCLVAIVVSQLAFGGALTAAAQDPNSRDNDTTTPIKHLIVIIGENRSFDHVFATYVPKKARLSEPALRRHHQGRREAGPKLLQGRAKAATDQAAGCVLLSPPQKSSFPGQCFPLRWSVDRRTLMLPATA